MAQYRSGEIEPVYLTLADVLELHALIIGATASEAADQLAHRSLGPRTGRLDPQLQQRRHSGLRLLTGPCWALGADTPRDAELRGDLACRRLGSERKYVKRIYARDTGKAGRQFAR